MAIVNKGLRNTPLNNGEIADLREGILKVEKEFPEVEPNFWTKYEVELVLPSIKSIANFIRYVRAKEMQLQNEMQDFPLADGSIGHFSLNVGGHVVKARTASLAKEDRETIFKAYLAWQKKYMSGTEGLMTRKREAFIRGFKTQKKKFKEVDGHYDVLLSLFSRMYDNGEIMSYMNNEHGVNLSLQAVKWFAEEYKEEIEKGKSSFTNDITTIRLSHKSSRLEQYQGLFLQAKELFTVTKKISYYNGMISVLDKIKTEVEGNVNKLEIDINGNININHAISMDKQQGLLENIHIYDIIIARASAKAGKSPLIYINALRESFYADIAGFGNVEKDEANVRISPSDFQYNLDDLEKKFNKYDEKAKKMAEIPLFEKADGSFDSKQKMLDVLDEEIDTTKKRNSNLDAFYKGDD